MSAVASDSRVDLACDGANYGGRKVAVALVTVWFAAGCTLFVRPALDVKAAPTPPAASYTAERMALRLQELAENPLPTPEELAQEFGIQWKVRIDGANAAGTPTTDYLATVVAKPLILKFEGVRDYSSIALRDWGGQRRLSFTFDPHALCVRKYRLEATLSKAPWSFQHRNNPAGGHHPAAVYHETISGDQVVHVRMYGSGCLETFMIIRYGPGIKPKIFLGEEQEMATSSGYVFTASSPVFASISRIIPDAKGWSALLSAANTPGVREVLIAFQDRGGTIGNGGLSEGVSGSVDSSLHFNPTTNRIQIPDDYLTSAYPGTAGTSSDLTAILVGKLAHELQHAAPQGRKRDAGSG